VVVPAAPEGELFAPDTPSRFGVAAGDEVLVGPTESGAELVVALGERP
jgi:hypothetical protein